MSPFTQKPLHVTYSCIFITKLAAFSYPCLLIVILKNKIIKKINWPLHDNSMKLEQSYQVSPVLNIHGGPLLRPHNYAKKQTGKKEFSSDLKFKD